MKKITLIVFVLAGLFGYSQTNFQDFESGSGIDGGFGDLGSTSIVMDATNGTMVAEIVASASGQVWQGANITVNAPIDLTQANPSDRQMEIDVYSNSAVDILVRVTKPGSAANEASAAVSHQGTGWETLTATFDTSLDGKPVANDTYNGFVVFPLWDTGTNGFLSPAVARTIRVDNIKGTEAAASCSDGFQNGDETGVDCGGSCPDACPTPPSVPPTVPPGRAPADVVSVYSNSYTQAPTDGFQTFGSAMVTEIDYSGNTIQQFTTPDNGSGLQYQYFGVTPQFLDLSAMTNAHIDFYFEGSPTTAGTVLIFIAQYSDGTNIQKSFDVTSLAANTWHEMDVAFADFDLNATNARDEIQQVIFQVAGPDGSVTGPVYFDNLYFHNNIVLSTNNFELENLKVYPNPSNSLWNIESANTVIEQVEVYDLLGKNVLSFTPNSQTVEIDASQFRSGLYLAKLTANGTSKTIRLVKN